MSYREHIPIPLLRTHVQCLWTLQGACDEPAPQRLVPDGCMSLVLNFGAPMEQVSDGGEATPRPRTLIIGEVRRPIAIQSAGRVELLGVRFWPGAIRSFVDAPVAAGFMRWEPPTHERRTDPHPPAADRASLGSRS